MTFMAHALTCNSKMCATKYCQGGEKARTFCDGKLSVWSDANKYWERNKIKGFYYKDPIVLDKPKDAYSGVMLG